MYDTIIKVECVYPTRFRQYSLTHFLHLAYSLASLSVDGLYGLIPLFFYYYYHYSYGCYGTLTPETYV